MANSLTQSNLFSNNVAATFPSTRYMGSKNKIVSWIWQHLKQFDFHTCLDAFGGTGTVAYCLKRENKEVTYNDVLKFNWNFGIALVENEHVLLEENDLDLIFKKHGNIDYPDLVERVFHDIYYTQEENIWIDRTITNIRQIKDKYKQAMAFFALSQACIVKRPYNLFHRKNLYVRTADVKRGFGNKTSWDRPFNEWFRIFTAEANSAVFKSEYPCHARCSDALDLNEHFDLVYIDTPYISQKGVPVDYADFYHFLEGLCDYDSWESKVDFNSKHRRLKRESSNPWSKKGCIYNAFEKLFEKYSDSILAISYRSDGIPSIDELRKLLGKYKKNVDVSLYGKYKYALSKNKKSQEVLIIGY